MHAHTITNFENS